MSTIITVPEEAAGQNLLHYLRSKSIDLPAACGGRGVCGKCKVRLLSGELSLKPDPDGFILACQVFCTEKGAVISVPDSDGTGLTDFASDGSQAAIAGVADPVGSGESADLSAAARLGAALDIGTTTLAMALVDHDSGKVLRTVSALNPQRSYGADVMTRITSAKQGNLQNLQTVLLKSIRALLLQLTEGLAGDTSPELLIATGNTTMLHLFLGISPEGMGQYPFTPAFTDIQTRTGDELGLPVGKVLTMPCASAFIGADIVGGALVSGFEETDDTPRLLLDIGTNGEMILSANGKLYAASTAAGPALEGTNISCGVGGIPGAVDHVSLTMCDGRQAVSYTTIQGKEPIGLCGCGLIDLCALLLLTGKLDMTGRLASPYTIPGTPVTLDQADIRQVQLAKSAIAAGILALADSAGITPDKILRTEIAGGLGFYLNTQSAFAIGLLPPDLGRNIESIGNSALHSACVCLTDPAKLESARQIASACKVIELNLSPVFNEAFIDNMLFGNEEDEE